MKIINLFNSVSSTRTKEAYKNIVASIGTKCLCIIVNLMIVPLTIDYVNPSSYGIWLTLSSIVGWITFFDLGLSNGFRNRFTAARACKNDNLAQQYLSTTYFLIGSIMFVVLVLMLLLNNIINWDDILRVDIVYRRELRRVFAIVGLFFCLNMVLKVISSMFNADQKTRYSSAIESIGSLLTLLAIYILTKKGDGSLESLALYFSGIPCLLIFVATIYFYKFTSYRSIKPRISQIKLDLTPDIMGLGVQFFFISLSLLAIFQVINIIISRELGPESVTQYNVAFKYYNMLHMVMTILITPFWSSFTDAFKKNDYGWMCNTIKKFEICWCFEVLTAILMFAAGPIFFKFWIGDSVEIPISLSVVMSVYAVSQSIGAIYMNVLNGVGKVRIQMYTYIVFALIAWPFLVWSCRMFGLSGILIAPTLVFLVQAVICKIQVYKLMNQKATGIWNK